MREKRPSTIAHNLPLLLGLSLVLCAGPAAFAQAPPAPGKAPEKTAVTKPKTLVAVHLREPDFAIWELKYRVFYNKVETKHLPIADYDFKTAFTDELLNALEGDKRTEWVMATGEEKMDLIAVYDKKTSPPASLSTDRILLVDVYQYGAQVSNLAADKFYLIARLKIVDKSGRRKFWEKKFFERIPLPGKIADLQADNQKALREGINTLIGQIAGKVFMEIRKASF